MDKLEEYINSSRQKELVENDKFDRHMKVAREMDSENKKQIFCQTTEHGEERRVRNACIIPSTY